MSHLLALDQASHISGWAVFEDGKLVKYGKIVTDADDVGERLYTIRQEIIKLIQEYKIDEIAFEDIQLQNNVMNNVATFKILAEVFGEVYELATELKIPHIAVLASTWKSTLGIKGKTRPEQKRNAQAYVMEHLNIKPTQDECDAICIGLHTLSKEKIINEDEGFDWS